MGFEEQILAFCLKNKLFSGGDRVCVAVSGGRDSIALLHGLLALQKQLGITVFAAHFHHGIRGAEADRDRDFVRSCCEDCGIDCVLGSGNAKQRSEQTGESLEEAARFLRLRFLESLDADKIATAHHLGDNAETVLMHLLRGTGLRGLAGIPVKRDRYVRPLLDQTRESIDAYLLEKGLPHIEDSTNETDDCLRNRLRHHVLPLLLQENPVFLQTLSRSGEILGSEDRYLSDCAAAARQNCTRDGALSCRELLGLDPVIRRRVLLGVLRELSLENPGLVHLEQLEKLIGSASPSASVQLPEGHVAHREYDRLLFGTPEADKVCPDKVLQIPGDTILSEISLKISAIVTESSQFLQKNDFTFSFRYDMIAPSVWSVRKREPGDMLLLRQGHRSLKKLLIDRKIPKAQRDRLPVLLCSGRIAGVLGLAVCEDFLPQPGRPVLTLTLQPLRQSSLRTEPITAGFSGAEKENPIE